MPSAEKSSENRPALSQLSHGNSPTGGWSSQHLKSSQSALFCTERPIRTQIESEVNQFWGEQFGSQNLSQASSSQPSHLSALLRELENNKSPEKENPSSSQGYSSSQNSNTGAVVKCLHLSPKPGSASLGSKAIQWTALVSYISDKPIVSVDQLVGRDNQGRSVTSTHVDIIPVNISPDAAVERLAATETSVSRRTPGKKWMRASKPRWQKTKEQEAILRKAYDESKFPSIEQRLALVKRTGLKEIQIRLWFQYRRNKDKKKRDNRDKTRLDDVSVGDNPRQYLPHS